MLIENLKIHSEFHQTESHLWHCHKNTFDNFIHTITKTHCKT